MPAVACPHADCPYITPDVGDATGAALITGHMMVHQPTAPPPARIATPNTKLEPVKRPIVSSEGTAEEWEYFLHRWEEYTMATNHTGPDRVQQLLECCDPALRLGISRQAGTSMHRHTEEQALAAIKLLAVRAENIEVATDALLAMHQDRDELVHVAETCLFRTECNATSS